MKGRKPYKHKLKDPDRSWLKVKVCEGQLVQRIAKRARALLALDSGERIGQIVRWIGLSRMALWYLWRRYQQRGVAAIFDGQRSGRPAVFSPSGSSQN
jgi:hypothetical protein